MTAELRPARLDDAPALLALALELGYPNDLLEIEERLRYLADQPQHAVMVAARDGRVVAFMHLYEAHPLESPAFAEIAGLVVTEKLRGSGIGGQLLGFAEQWAREHGLSRIGVRANVKRVRTHAFYRAHGFEEQKDQKVFLRKLGNGSA